MVKNKALQKSLLSISLALFVSSFAISTSFASSPSLSQSMSSTSFSQVSNVVKVDFDSDDNGMARLTIEFDNDEKQTNLRFSEKEIMVDMKNVSFPSEMVNAPPLDVSDFNTPVQYVFVTQSNSHQVLHLRLSGEHKTPNVFELSNKYILEISPWLETPVHQSIVESDFDKTIGASEVTTSATLPKPFIKSDDGADKVDGVYSPAIEVSDEDGAEPSISTQPSTSLPVATQVNNDPVASVASSTASQRQSNSNLTYASPATSGTLSQPVYSGSPVTFNFQDVPVRTILQLIAEESEFNVVAADTVQGNITLRLDGVPWDQALDTLLRAQGLDKRQQGNVIWIAPQSEIAEYERAREQARIAMDNSEDLATEYIQINYHSASAIFEALTGAQGITSGGTSEGQSGSSADTGFLSPRGRIVVDERTNTLMVSDIPRKISEMKELLAVIDRPVDQVLIEARVVVATETFARELGVKFGGLANIDNVVIGGNLSNNPVTNPLGSIGLSFLNAGNSLDVEFSAMEREGRGEVISNPRVVTTNQREALISQGREVGYVTMTGGAGGGPALPNVEFKEVLLEMRVTPTITQDGRVFLDMNVKKDEILSMIDTSIGVVPEISKRQINTAVLVGDGQTVVVGGVYEINDANDISKVPFFGDIPFLGNLFKKRGRSKEKAELLVFITPKVLRVAKPVATAPPPATQPDVSHLMGSK